MTEKTVFRKKKIAVVSKRRNVSDFFRLEAENCACHVNVMSVMPAELSEYDVLILDDVVGASASYDLENIYRIIPNNAQASKNTLYWPVSVGRVREILDGYITEPKAGIKEEESSLLRLLDGKEKAVIHKNQLISLTDNEYKVLSRLLSANGEAVSREELSALLGADGGNIVDVYICRLRGKLEAPFGTRIIRTVRGKGYSLFTNSY